MVFLILAEYVISTPAAGMSDEDNGEWRSQNPKSRSFGSIYDDEYYSREWKLRDRIDRQRQEISLLKKQLAALGVSPNTPMAQTASPGSKMGKSDVHSALKLTSSQENNPVENLAELSDDLSVKLAFPALLKGLTGMDDVRNVKKLCQTVIGDEVYGNWQTLFKSFYHEVVSARDSIPLNVAVLETSLPTDWYKEPWYLLYVQRTGVPDHKIDAESTFDDLRRMLPYIRDCLGFSNVCLLSHYESPMADGGFDVSAFTTRESLGGEEGFERFMRDACAFGLRVVTEAVFSHTSTKHEWFQRALKGDEKYLAYYIQRNGREKTAEWESNGDVICRYCDPDGTITDRAVFFPDIDRTHGLWVEINGKTYQFYRSFFPFEVDLNLQNPEVLAEIFRILARELKQGVMGKRMGNIAHWIKQPGSSGDGLPECHAVQALLKSFIKHINARAIIIPEVVRDMASTAKYTGFVTAINGEACCSEGDVLFSFESQAALREMTFFRTIAPYWRTIFRTPALPKDCTWINLLEHHNETYMQFFARDVRVWLAEYIKTHHGAVYKNGLSAGGRIADCLNNNPKRIATALFLLYITPGTPLVYAGTEIGARSDSEHAEKEMRRSHEVFRSLGVYADESSCYDARELQRACLPKATFDGKTELGYEGVTMVRRMNELWTECRWLREGETNPIDSGDLSVLCMGKGTDSKSDRVICMANLTDRERWAAVPIKQATTHWALSFREEVILHKTYFVDILTDRTMKVLREISILKFRLAAFDRAVVKIVPIPE